jgi:single-strand DNA-binding protein
MNRVILMGRLTKDPEVRYSRGEKAMAIARYTLAVDRRGRRSQDGQEQTADFIRCVAFDKAGEFAEKYFRQGMRILVSGRIQTGSYINAENVKVYTFDVMIDRQEFADSKNAGDSSGYQSTFHPESSGAIGDDFMNLPDGMDEDGLPFH